MSTMPCFDFRQRSSSPIISNAAPRSKRPPLIWCCSCWARIVSRPAWLPTPKGIAMTDATFDALRKQLGAKVGAARAKSRKKKNGGTPEDRASQLDFHDLLVDGGNLPSVAFKVRDLLADSGRLFDRGMPVKLV